MKKWVVLAVIAIFTVGCGDEKNVQVSISGAEQTTPPNIKKNSKGRTVEQQNIYDRTIVTTDPTKIMWIHLIGLDGKVINRMPVRGKVTSSGKRLEVRKTTGRPTINDNKALPQYNGWETEDLIQPDGTYGSSDPYIYWFDPMGRYHQYGTAGGIGYLVTDYPIDLTDPMDEVTGLYKVSKAAAEWQNLEEKKLK